MSLLWAGEMEIRDVTFIASCKSDMGVRAYVCVKTLLYAQYQQTFVCSVLRKTCRWLDAIVAKVKNKCLRNEQKKMYLQ